MAGLFSDNLPVNLPVVTRYFLRSTGAFTPQQVKAAPGTLYALHVTNTSVADAYFGLYDKLASPTPGTDLLWDEILVKTGTMVALPLAPGGVAFTNGLWVFSATAEYGAAGSAAGIIVGIGFI